MFTLVLAIILLFVGAELALNAAEKVGKLFNIPPLLIGLLIIGPGTSLPEFFVSHLAALNGQGQMAMGNIVGSNISNLLLVLGISLVIQKITVANKAIFRQISIHLLLSLILSVVLLFSKLHILSCLVLMAFFWGYLGDTYLNMKNQSESKPPGKRALLNSSKENILLFGKLVAGFGLLYYGGEVLVQSGNDLCRLWGISEYMISAIFIALGTSLPELVTSLLTTLRKKNLELIVGNVIGSNILNVAFVMASTYLLPY